MKDLILNNKDLIISKLVEKNTVNSKGLIEMINVLSAELVVYADIERLRKYFGGEKFRIVKNSFYYEVGLYIIECNDGLLDPKKISNSKKKVDNFELLNTQLVSELGSDYWVEPIVEVKEPIVEVKEEPLSEVKEAVVEVKEEVKEPVNQKELIRLIKFKYKEISDLIQLLDDVKEPLSDIKEPIVEVKEEPIIEPISEPKPKEKEKEYFNIKLLHAGRPNRGQNRTKYIKRVVGINMHEKEAKRFEGEYLNAGENLLCNDDVIICTGWDGSSNQRRQYKVVDVWQVQEGDLMFIDTFNYKSQFVSLTVKINELLSYSVQTNAA